MKKNQNLCFKLSNLQLAFTAIHSIIHHQLTHQTTTNHQPAALNGHTSSALLPKTQKPLLSVCWSKKVLFCSRSLLLLALHRVLQLLPWKANPNQRKFGVFCCSVTGAMLIEQNGIDERIEEIDKKLEAS